MTAPSAAELEGKRYDLEMIVSYFNSPGYNDVFLLMASPALSESMAISQPISTNPREEGLYNLQGQRFDVSVGSAVLPKGVYILNGKKIIIH